MAIPALIPLITLIATALANVASFIMQAIRTLNSIPWKRIFWWAVLGVFVGYFSAIIWSLVVVSVQSARLVFGSSNMAYGRPPDLLGRVFDFSGLWTNLSILPDFWRFFLWFVGADWFLWLFACGVHFWFVGYLLERFSKPIGTMLHKALEAL